MISDRTVRDSDGHTAELRPHRPEWQPKRPEGQDSAGPGQGTRLAGPTMRRPSRFPRAESSWSRFLVAHARWILVVTLAVVAAAGALALLQTPRYVSVADVLVQAGPGATQEPDMGTEAGVAASGAVLARASRSLHVPEAELANGLSVREPGTTFLLQISYSDQSPRVAQQRAQAVALAYVSYRTSQPARAPRGTTPAQSAAPTAALITPASLPASPTSPNYAVDIGAALLVGLALAIGTAGLRDYLDDRLRSPLELEAQSDTPVLALIPAFRSSPPNPGARLAMTASPDSGVAQAYRSLRTRLVQAAPANAMTLLVTSPAGRTGPR